MSNEFTFRDVRDRFIEIEKRYEVFNLKVDNVYFWKLIRFELFDAITRKLNILKDGHPLTKKDKIKRLFLLLKYSLFNIVRRSKVGRNDVIVLTHGRKQKYGEEYIDIYLSDILNDFRKNGKKVLVIDRPDHYGRHYNAHYQNMIYFERFGHLIRDVLYKFRFFDVREVQHLVGDIEHELRAMFGCDFDLVSLIKKRVFRFEYEKKYFDKILDRCKPCKVYLVASYGKEELIASAHQRSVEVVETQHGVISDYHMGYYFPYDYPIPYFPDEILLFGQYWKDSIKFPINNKQTVWSFKFLKKNNDARSFDNKSESVMFISQGSIGDQLSKVAAAFVNENEIPCFYKLHPSEFNSWERKYPELADSVKNGRVKVISNEMSIYELFTLCKYSIGVYSTAIYESLMYECKTYLIDIEGYQYMEFLIDNNHVKLLPRKFSVEDLTSFLSNPIANKSYFYM